ncbi:MAG: MerR family transcriptional regulator [bacterium]|nr:MAG: MerR family transcriptional regulator [bacterium]
MVTKDTEQQKYTLEELSQAVTNMLGKQGLLDAQQDNRVSAAPDARTIRYYTTLGLLDRPSIIGRQAYYGYRHLLQIVTIKALQKLSLPLSEIQAKLYGRSDQELTDVLTAISQDHAKRPIEIRLVHWQEVTIEPGLKIMVEEGWTPTQNITAITEKIQAGLTALANSSKNN